MRKNGTWKSAIHDEKSPFPVERTPRGTRVLAQAQRCKEFSPARSRPGPWGEPCFPAHSEPLGRALHFSKGSCVGQRPPAGLQACLASLLRSAPRTLTAPARRWDRDTKQRLYLPSEVSPQPSWLRPLWRGRKSAVSQATRQTEVAGLGKSGGACAGKMVGRAAGALVTQRLPRTRVFFQLRKD